MIKKVLAFVFGLVLALPLSSQAQQAKRLINEPSAVSIPSDSLIYLDSLSTGTLALPPNLFDQWLAGQVAGTFQPSYIFVPFTSTNGITIPGTGAFASSVNVNVSPTTVVATTAGNLYWSQPYQGSAYKKTVLNFVGYENTTATAQTITFTTPYSYAPTILGSSPSGMTVSTTGVTLPISMAATFTGQCFIEGQ